jgi:hypothetical protein
MTHQFIMKNGLKGFQPLAGLLGDDTTPSLTLGTSGERVG